MTEAESSPDRPDGSSSRGGNGADGVRPKTGINAFYGAANVWQLEGHGGSNGHRQFWDAHPSPGAPEHRLWSRQHRAMLPINRAMVSRIRATRVISWLDRKS